MGCGAGSMGTDMVKADVIRERLHDRRFEGGRVRR